jgi:hypothetical protein
VNTYEDSFTSGNHQLLFAVICGDVQNQFVVIRPLGAFTRLIVYSFDDEMSFENFHEVFAAMATTLTDLTLGGIFFRDEPENERSTIDLLALVSPIP